MLFIAIKLRNGFFGNGDFSLEQRRRSLPIPGFESNNISQLNGITDTFIIYYNQ